jgi:hypothetical protein
MESMDVQGMKGLEKSRSLAGKGNAGQGALLERGSG